LQRFIIPAASRISEKPLELALLRGVALLHLGAAAFQRFHRVGLGGAGGSAAAVPAGAPAQKYHGVAGYRVFPAHVFRGHRAHHGADLHALGGVAGVVQLDTWPVARPIWLP
jgi:hypothetical protein